MMVDQLRTVKTDHYTIKSGHLDVGDGHKIWFQQWGNPKAKTPIIMFHGGPGSEFKPYHTSLFDPKTHQIVAFDQRGCGNSLPHGSTKCNTTQDLLKDAAKLLEHLKIDTVYAYGGSWGSTMATLFTLEYPTRTKATIINGVFTGTQAEIDYIDKGYFKNQFPEVWERFVQTVPPTHRDDPAAYHYQRLNDNSRTVVETSAKALENLEAPLLQFDWAGYRDDIQVDTEPGKPKESYDDVPYKIYGHYLENACFLEPDYIVKNASSIKPPFYIVQGRYDMCCPPVTAYNLHKAIKHSKLFITLGSHNPRDPENRSALRALVGTVFT